MAPRFRHHRTCLELTRILLELVDKDSNMRVSRQSVRKGVAVWRPTDRPDKLFILQRGRVNVVGADEHGRELLVQVVNSGEPFGEVCFCAEDGGDERGSTATAVMASEVLSVEYSAILKHLRHRNDLVDALMVTFCERLTDCTLRAEALAERDAERRVGKLLLLLAIRPHQPGKKVADLLVTHREIAQLASVTRPHVTVILNRFKLRKAVAYGRTGPMRVWVDRLAAVVAGSAEPS